MAITQKHPKPPKNKPRGVGGVFGYFSFGGGFLLSMTQIQILDLRLGLANFLLGWFTKKAPHKSPKYSVFPTLFGTNMGLVGGFFGGPIQMEN